MPHAVYLILSLAAVLVAALFGWLLRGKLGRMKISEAENIAERVLAEAAPMRYHRPDGTQDGEIEGNRDRSCSG